MKEEKKSFKEMLEESKQAFRVEVRNKKRWLFCGIELLFVLVLIAADMLTKEYVYGACLDHKINIIDGVFSFVAVQNTGASFGMLSDKTLYLTVLSSVCAAVLIFFIFYSYKYRNLWLRSSLILITAGAIGNIIDRVMLGYVRDFIYFELIDFAVFNFADSCLTVGTIVMIVYILFFYSKDQEKFAEAKKQALVENKEEIVVAETEKADTDTETEDNK